MVLSAYSRALELTQMYVTESACMRTVIYLHSPSLLCQARSTQKNVASHILHFESQGTGQAGSSSAYSTNTTGC